MVRALKSKPSGNHFQKVCFLFVFSMLPSFMRPEIIFRSFMDLFFDFLNVSMGDFKIWKRFGIIRNRNQSGFIITPFYFFYFCKNNIEVVFFGQHFGAGVYRNFDTHKSVPMKDTIHFRGLIAHESVNRKVFFFLVLGNQRNSFAGNDELGVVFGANVSDQFVKIFIGDFFIHTNSLIAYFLIQGNQPFPAGIMGRQKHDAFFFFLVFFDQLNIRDDKPFVHFFRRNSQGFYHFEKHITQMLV